MSRGRGRTYAAVADLRARHRSLGEPIRRRLDDFAAVPTEEYFYELVYCLLTPQSSAVHAGKAVEVLKQAGDHADSAAILANRDHYIRFHNTKAKRISEARAMLPQILHCLSNGADAPDLREWLVANVKGLGLKEASHFLRNIGYRDLAILDRHVLKHLKKHGVLRSVPGSLTRRRYLAIEVRFARFAADIGIPMDELDLLFWSAETGEILK